MAFKSSTMNLYVEANKSAGLSAEQIAFADEVFYVGEKNYADGGQWVVECMEPADIVRNFKSMADAVDYMGLIQDRCDDVRNS